VGINTAKQMSRDEALKKVDMLQKEWARQHRLVEE
jgi:hypothetical protein